MGAAALPDYYADRMAYYYIGDDGEYVTDDMGNSFQLSPAAYLQNMDFSYSDDES